MNARTNAVTNLTGHLLLPLLHLFLSLRHARKKTTTTQTSHASTTLAALLVLYLAFADLDAVYVTRRYPLERYVLAHACVFVVLAVAMECKVGGGHKTNVL